MKSLACATVLALALAPSYGLGQAPMGHSMSDEDLIKLALSAAPEAIAKDATVIAKGADGKMRTLRQGTGPWTCKPGHADAADPDPNCGDRNAMEWSAAVADHKDPPANKVGFVYMLPRGQWRKQHRTVRNPGSARQLLGQDWPARDDRRIRRKMLDGYPRELKADPTKPYVMWPGSPVRAPDVPGPFIRVTVHVPASSLSTHLTCAQ